MNWIHTLTSQSATVVEYNKEIMKLTMETTAGSGKRYILFLTFFHVINISS